MNAWKAVYSNNDTRPTALEWFWEHYDPTEFSVWQVAYKFNEELTLPFMSANLIGGVFQSVDGGLHKGAFGSLMVLRDDEDSGSRIEGFFVFKGQEPLFTLGDSFTFTMVEVADPAVRAKFEAALAWDEPGFVAGKIFK